MAYYFASTGTVRIHGPNDYLAGSIESQDEASIGLARRWCEVLDGYEDEILAALDGGNIEAAERLWAEAEREARQTHAIQ